MDEMPPKDDDALDAATRDLAEHRELLFSIGYNILGTVADTEDVLQETWLSWAGADRASVDNVRAYLVRITVNEAMSRLRRMRRMRETYVGPWLPEPLISAGDASDEAVRTESVSIALMVVLETLTPLERAVFVLREAFGYGHPEIAEILGRSPAAVRQLAHRAREHVHARRPRTEVDEGSRRAVTERFLAAAAGGDLTALMDVLAPDVELRTDTGGKVRAARQVMVGRDKVARLFASDRVFGELSELTVGHVVVNGEPAVALLHPDGSLHSVGVIEVSEDGRHVCGIYGVINPDKLRRIAGRVWSTSGGAV
ncbi:sigma-70 family RNA polymerase sigma factor [Phytoactinopolyspora alkaliphila]|uniref:Sigma-70 family RNA polymerase sigma factor n=1 Tax=Phytoactinopolyspora alkaliphila TaxID=1783498 RepID=A0A6N9YKT5_9ACTN|nr:RNA polymerase sigma factor SigJ [Phytoactinopolyspora alkaliphila]NED95530.1 sigma-70 family RNA polymerase sigma factor [Phytoactinopolyspora alkaliphila]